ncbi:CsgE family curli-type amyloid fiber assembly protein [Actimicrobium sp. CCI2.3]|uniref:CsgE family curli-type amyloid fiber assembly protein n=1 Tax=Actimicrobium sp. CCI2.3 TaxID=3048616 RepID=UPI002AB4BEF7|nr:CsgE family curli-type amyloid fiber assembly protein [Actimicrobium sp. CCI2.3]MDY7574741.1 CsgE family curli-type amyloid fiber assembly protein [Actimicrobium sp. CCI2.3]MEB0020298.1 CsgE family curli-type amyloid fiber assembly protein [Actimicrobium sp. CCI2.3]
MPLKFLLRLPSFLSGLSMVMTLLVVTLPVCAQEATDVDSVNAMTGLQAPEAVTADGVGGLVVNATTTGLGQEFFRNFNEFWREKSEGEKFTLTIAERASRRTGNQITVLFGQKVMYSGFLPYKLNLIRAFTEQAVETVYGNLISLDMFANSAADSDLAPDEL